MHKVIVERPRWTPGPDKYARRANLHDELLPKFEGIKRIHTQKKGQRDLLGPLHRWLHSKVGCLWNDVYSEACAVIHPNNYVRVHVKTHLLEYVERNTFMHKGKVCVLEAGCRGRDIIPVTERRYGWNFFFVHPESGLLSAIPQKSRKALRAERRASRAENFRWLDGNFALKQIEGIWFACQFRAVSPEGPFKAYDHAVGQQVGRGGLMRSNGQYLHCINKRQLSRRELKRHGLHNAPTAERSLQLTASVSIEDCAEDFSGSLSNRNPQPWRSYGKSSIRSRQPVFSKSRASVARDSHLRLKSNADSASCTGIKSFRKSSVAMTLAPVVQDAAFKRCCLRSGRYDGARRNYYFRE